jgi:hypothetical protein
MQQQIIMKAKPLYGHTAVGMLGEDAIHDWVT